MAPQPSERCESLGGRASSRSRSASGPPGIPRLAGGPSTTSPLRRPTSPNAGRWSLMPPARTMTRSGRRSATAAISAASSPSARRSSAAGGSPAPTRTPWTLASSSRVVIASGSICSVLAETVRQPLRDAVATSGASPRSEAATTAIFRGGLLATSRRGSSMAPPRRRSRTRASAGSASTARSPRAPMMASMSAPAGIVTDPISRQRGPTRPIIAAATVAAPMSRARKARGSLVIRQCYPARRARGSSAGRSGPVRRPRRSRRPTPRAGR